MKSYFYAMLSTNGDWVITGVHRYGKSNEAKVAAYYPRGEIGNGFFKSVSWFVRY